MVSELFPWHYSQTHGPENANILSFSGECSLQTECVGESLTTLDCLI